MRVRKQSEVKKGSEKASGKRKVAGRKLRSSGRFPEDQCSNKLWVPSVGMIPSSDEAIDPRSRWVVFEFTEDLSLERSCDNVENFVMETFGRDVLYFIPIYRERLQDKFITFVLFDGYIFIRESKEVLSGVSRLNQNEYIKGPLREKGGYRTVGGREIIGIRRELMRAIYRQFPKKKDTVIPKVGMFSNLEGEVISVDKPNLTVLVQFKLKTRIVEAPISVINLEKADI